MSDSYKIYASQEYVDGKVSEITSLPENAGSNQQLVTDMNGEVTWEERLGYKTIAEVTFLEESETYPQMADVHMHFGYMNSHEFIVGETYKVNFDGTLYECVATQTESYGIALGNLSYVDSDIYEDTGEPFGCAHLEPGSTILFIIPTGTLDSYYTISVVGPAVVIQPIPGDYIAGGLYKGSGDNSFQMKETQANQMEAIALGNRTVANGRASIAMGTDTTAKGPFTIAEGQGTVATVYAQHAQGRYNIEDTEGKYAHIVGNGKRQYGVTTASNAYTLDWDGTGWFANGVKVGGAGQDDAAAEKLVTQSELEAAISAGGGSGVSSWNDLTDKPFGIEPVEGSVFPETTLEVNEEEGAAIITEPLLSDVVADQTYIVNWNGTKYERTANIMSLEGIMMSYIGNVGPVGMGDDTGEPFLFMAVPSHLVEAMGGFYAAAYAFDGSTSVTLSVGGLEIKKLDNKYLDLYWLPTEQSMVETEFISERETTENGHLTISSNEIDESMFAVGTKIVVYIDGERYESTVASIEQLIYAGNMSLLLENAFNTGEPYLIVVSEDVTQILTSSESIHKVSVYTYAPGQNKLPNEFIPNEVALKEYVDEKLTEIEIPSIEGLASKSYVDEKVAAIEIPSIEGLASETYVDEKVASMVDSAPETLNTLNELAAALGDDPNFATTIVTQLGEKANISDVPTNLKNGIRPGSLRTIYSAPENDTYILGMNAFAEGGSTKAIGVNSHAEGSSSVSFNDSSHAEGCRTTAYGDASHAEGYSNSILSVSLSGVAGALTYSCTAVDANWGHQIICLNNIYREILSVDVKNATITVSNTLSQNNDLLNAEAHLIFSVAYGSASHVEGFQTTASGYGSHAEGFETKACEPFSHAEGYQSKAYGPYSHAEGVGSIASGNTSHAEGGYVEALGDRSHAEGSGTEASGEASHAEGYVTRANGAKSHAEGDITYANGECSHTEGYFTIASGINQHVQGRYNIEDTNDRYAHIVGNGTAGDERSNGHTLDWQGNAWFQGSVYVGGTDQDTNSEKLMTQSEVATMINEALAAFINGEEVSY